MIERRPHLHHGTEDNVLAFGPCRCPLPDCPLKSGGPPLGLRSRGSRDAGRPALERVRAEIQADIARRRRFGSWGRGEG
ncbi:hypothetical protein [Streptomyces clavuligerus]|uniref:Uncharacterized protein n=1 Tax=Streptomyces clavuligerus TaxID=1901 RepID=B5GU94_STRCL|nr:hypothetical protein [Streptomyces clavuligerus]ANW19154.1 hypothetical protein BB341_13465 [Streptomyces clavuligerus]AXU13738.1 hypothetical protein D1794_13955 [Streptomyces clavuligerus]EDY49891.1 hypothetical protein SSCG_02918 [Streptomyces clavuligerus]EFG08095.1 Hypothetical protein SCLAV_3024 [Streptomyces clavuligerus]MBY6303714.1 hypothetical protein [Streptomyces clavuligerus]